MTGASFFNPARRVVGRVFLWFWATFLIAAVVALWIGRTFIDNVEVSTPEEKEIAVLDNAAKRLKTARRTPPLRFALERISRQERTMLVAVERQSNTVIQGSGPRLRPKEQLRIRRLVSQQAPIALVNRGSRIVGPQRLTYDGKQIALFVVRPNRDADNSTLLFSIVVVALVITMLLSYLFARHLVKPVLQVQRCARQLAEGNWQVRIDDASKRQDEIGQLSRDFNQMAAHLEKMWIGQQRLLADISHELRSPLARLQMALGLAWQQNIDSDTLTRIERESERMDELIGQLLHLTRAESHKTERESVTLDVLLNALCSDARFEAENINKQVNVGQIPSQTVNVDKEMARRAIENVLRNAIHYASHCVDVTVSVKDTYWEVAVCDDGPGLTAEECEQIFTPFYRTTQARDRASGGVGLGLAIAKAAAHMHDGSVQARPHEGGGLCVTFRFPLDSK